MMNLINKKYFLMCLCLLFCGADVFSQGFGGQQALEQLRLFKSQADNDPTKSQNVAGGMPKNLDDFKKTLNMGDDKKLLPVLKPQRSIRLLRRLQYHQHLSNHLNCVLRGVY